MSTTSSVPSPRTSLLRSVPALRRMWLARSISFTCDGIAAVAVVLAASRSGVGGVAAVLLASTLPQLAGPLAGAVVDRLDQRRLMIMCDLGQMLAYLTLAVARPPLPVMIPIIATSACLVTLFGPAGKSLVVDLVPTDRLSEANSLLSAAANLQLVAGPAVGAALIASLGLQWSFGINAASFLVSALLLSRIPPATQRTASSDKAAGSVLASTRDGLRYVRRTPAIRAVVIGLVVFVSFASMDNIAVLFLVRDSLHDSEAVYGLLLATFGIGLLVGSAVAPRIDRRLGTGTLLLTGLAVGAVGTAITGLAPLFAVAVIGQVLGGIGNAGDEIATSTLAQRITPADMLGRVFGTIGTAAQAGTAAAYLVAPVLVDAVGPRTTLCVAAVGMALSGLIMRPAFGPKHGTFDRPPNQPS